MHDTWNTVGMRATASNDFEVTDAQIPGNWVFDLFSPMRRDDPLYRLPMWFIVKHAGNTTALARRAIDEAIEAAQTKMVMPQRQLLIDQPDTLEAIARAEAATRSARAFLVSEIERVWQACVEGGDLSLEFHRSVATGDRQCRHRRRRRDSLDVRSHGNHGDQS